LRITAAGGSIIFHRGVDKQIPKLFTEAENTAGHKQNRITWQNDIEKERKDGKY
jgi:hypothetical protein